MALRNQFTHNVQNSDGTLTNEQSMVQNLVIESIQTVGFNGYYLPRVSDNVDNIFLNFLSTSIDSSCNLDI